MVVAIVVVVVVVVVVVLLNREVAKEFIVALNSFVISFVCFPLPIEPNVWSNSNYIC